MRSGIAFFLAGTLLTGGLFQFDLGIPSFHAKQFLAQKAKVDKAKSTIKNRRAKLSKKTIKNAGKKAAGSLIPFVGTVLTLGLAADDFCDDLENIVELQNILDGQEEEFNLEACLKEAESIIKAQFD